MRIALVSPYSWTYPGGVTRHIEALAEHYLAAGHHVRVLAPLDLPDAASTILHRGARPQPLSAPDYLIPLGRTVGFKANGAVSNLVATPPGAAKLVRELRDGAFDVAHVHEPIVPLTGWATCALSGLPLVGTFHSYSTKRLPNAIGNALGATQMLNRLHVRIAVSEAAAWTGRRWFGGRYRVIPNGVYVDPEQAARAAARPMGDALRIVFVGQAVERKGLPMLLRAFEALREHVPTELTVVGPTEHELAPLLIDSTGVRALGKVDDERKHDELLRADVLCAPSLGGESFGMVLTEAFAAGTPVIASDIPGYRAVVRDGLDGVLVPVGDPLALAEALRDLYHEPERRRRLAITAAADAQRFSWETVASEVLNAYEEAIEVPQPQTARERTSVRLGLRPADMKPRVRAQRLESLESSPRKTTRDKWANARRAGMLGISAIGVVLGILALRSIGVGQITRALISSSPTFVLLGLATMCAAMAVRGVAWFAILRAALPRARIHISDAIQGTFIGVLMSSTLPARLGEPARALVVARRTGRPRENLPAVLGTVLSQTLLNILALAILGTIMFSAVDVFNGHQEVLLIVAAVPAALVTLLLLAPFALRYGPGGSPGSRLHHALEQLSGAMVKVRDGLAVFRRPRLGAVAAGAQLSAWAIQSLSCYLLLLALGLGPRTGIAAAAGVLFAVNVTAVLPATPANLGVFQAACAAVLLAGWHIPLGTGVAYGVILQAVEVTTAVLMGMPALLREGMSWREVRMRAVHAAPVRLTARRSDPISPASPALSSSSQG